MTNDEEGRFVIVSWSLVILSSFVIPSFVIARRHTRNTAPSFRPSITLAPRIVTARNAIAQTPRALAM